MNTVVIPCFNRPEFLFWCLERIKLADGAERNQYLFCLDYGHAKENHEIISAFPFKKQVVVRPRTQNQITKQSRNVLEGLKEAASMSGNTDAIVYLIEDDVMIATDFFLWHERIHTAENVFAAIGSKNVNRVVNFGSNRLEDYYLSNTDYCGIGASFRVLILEAFVFPHVVNAYYDNCISYVITMFPNSIIGHSFAEQDGLIRRIQIESGLPTCYPCVPRSFHAGFYGKGRQQRFYIADLKKRISKIGEIIFSKGQMAKFAQSEYFYYDSEPIDLNHDSNYTLNKLQ